jgi:lipopolysaccharide export system permease protein
MEAKSVTLLDRYILRQAGGAFLLVLGILTAVVWLTSALRELDLVTGQGQTFFIFFTITGLALPMLIAYIAPFAMFIAFVFVLNKLNGDSELVVMSACGMSQPRFARPLILLALIVTLASWVMSLLVVPGTLRQLRQYIHQVEADVISNVLQAGRFTPVETNLVFHIRDRSPNGALLGIFMDDRRDPKLHMTYLATQGIITKTAAGTFLIMEDGQIIREELASAQTSIIVFERYAYNLSAYMSTGEFTSFPPSERWTHELVSMNQDPKIKADERISGRLRSELHDRLATPLYPLAFALIALASLGRARTTRQSRNESVTIAIIAVVLLRVAGFGASGFTQRSEFAAIFIYLAPLAGIALAGVLALQQRSPGEIIAKWMRPRIKAAGALT